ncbi:unknown protein [Seminavis robusta]|uniref:Uncharacterized protein n=1 Tax=Seminavis robusta TaxID=568900 RepID=A0A9N8HQB1_9STRA|nr:unknown protein [Seminavis robusta]|eukprot:Sro1421_g271240.1 n/a (194) ;mRNA; r:25700-26345
MFQRLFLSITRSHAAVKDNRQQLSNNGKPYTKTPRQEEQRRPYMPPSAKSANSDTKASSNATLASCTTSVTESSAEASTAETFPVPLPPMEGGEGEEEEEEEEEFQQQKGLPDEIKNRKYLDKHGNLLEVELLKDIEEFGLEDRDIDLNSDGIAHWRLAPSRMHQEAVRAIDYRVTVSQGEENDRLRTDQGTT